MANLKLVQASKPLTCEQHIYHFIQGIMCVTDQTIVVSIADHITICTSFDTYYNVLASRIELALSLTLQLNKSETRHVNNTTDTINKKKLEHKNPGNNKYSKNSPLKDVTTLL